MCIKVTTNVMDPKIKTVRFYLTILSGLVQSYWTIKKRSEKESLNLSLSVTFHQVSFTKQSLWQSGCDQHSPQLRRRPLSQDRRGLRAWQHDSSSLLLILFLFFHHLLFFNFVEKQLNALVENNTGVNFRKGGTVTACTELQSL